MRHFFSPRVRAVLIISLVIAVLLAVASNLTGKNIPAMAVQTVMTPLRTGAKVMTDQAQQLYDYIFRFQALQAENDRLKEDLSQIQQNALEADSLKRENERLRKLLELKAAHEDYQLVDGYIIARSSGDWVSTLTLNRGASAGIQVGMCAITENGVVVGLITEVGSNYCVVTTVMDSSIGISATIADTGYAGIVTGGYSSGHGELLRMEYLRSDALIRNNDQVVTAGSTVYPRNLILGHVVDAGYEENGTAKYAYLQPAVDVDSLEQIFVLTDYDAE
ncbi:MAG: rod shape-determining protein MreC [Ruminococcaceae bacterium]|nr:rod shape-determining protein MreC [Oscillospiraceae bacterium]